MNKNQLKSKYTNLFHKEYCMKKRFDFIRFAQCSLLALALSSPATAMDRVKSMVQGNVTGNFIHAVTPSVVQSGDVTRIWLSGWMNKDQVSSSTIYYIEKRGDGPWSTPRAAFVKENHEIDEPSVLMHSSGEWYLMFYHEVIPAKPGLYKPRSERHAIGVAYGVPCKESKDGSGICWTDYSKDRPFIGPEDGRGNIGGTSPSAFFNGNEIWLYYRPQDGKGSFARARIEYGNLKIQKVDRLTIKRFEPVPKKWITEQASKQGAYSSASVARVGNKYVMVANAGFSNGITRLESEDGVNFIRVPFDNNSAFIYSESDHLLTPDIQPLSSNSFRVYYGFGPRNSACSRYLSAGGAEFFCSGSLQEVTVLTEPVEAKK